MSSDPNKLGIIYLFFIFKESSSKTVLTEGVISKFHATFAKVHSIDLKVMTTF